MNSRPSIANKWLYNCCLKCLKTNWLLLNLYFSSAKNRLVSHTSTRYGEFMIRKLCWCGHWKGWNSLCELGYHYITTRCIVPLALSLKAFELKRKSFFIQKFTSTFVLSGFRLYKKRMEGVGRYVASQWGLTPNVSTWNNHWRFSIDY